jgi:calcium-dependent protein kinase
MIRDSEINYTLPAFARLKPLQQDLLKRLLAKDPDKRLSADGT